MKRIFISLALLSSVFTYSQVGIGTPEPDISAELDITSTDKGVLIPRVALKDLTDTTTITNGNVNSLIVFNTNETTDLQPGYYYWYNDRWLRMISQNDDSIKEPWKVQNTENHATANTENIYQQGKVAVGFTKDDPISNKKFEVKGNVKFIDKTAKGYYNWLESDVDLTSLGAADEDITLNIFGSFEEPSFSAIYDNAAAMYTALGKNENGGKTAGLGLVSSTDAKYGSQFILNSNMGGMDKANFSISSTDVEKSSSSGIVGSSQNITLVAQDNSNQTHLFIDPQKGGIMFTNRINSSAAVESYIFPRTKGTKHQVLTVGDPGTPFNSNKLEWKDVDDLTTGPKYFHAPSIVLPVVSSELSSGMSYDSGSGEFTVNLHTIYANQFGMTGDVSGVNRTALRSDQNDTLPVHAATELSYFITYFDNTVFDPQNITLSSDGILKYKVLTTDITERTYMNIVFKVK